jgi:hypothetical protein
MSLPSLYEVIKTTINNPLFLEKHRLLKNAFTRNRLLNFPTLILYLSSGRYYFIIKGLWLNLLALGSE